MKHYFVRPALPREKDNLGMAVKGWVLMSGYDRLAYGGKEEMLDLLDKVDWRLTA